MSDRGYYKNSLKAWRDELLVRQRQIDVRYQRMSDMKHPDANDQGILSDINRKLIEVVESAQRVAVALEPTNT